MSSKKGSLGIHHITTIAGSAANNVAFYENALGLSQEITRTTNNEETTQCYTNEKLKNEATLITAG